MVFGVVSLHVAMPSLDHLQCEITQKTEKIARQGDE